MWSPSPNSAFLFLVLLLIWRTRERLCMNGVTSLLSMRRMLRGYTFEPRPNSRERGTASAVMVIDILNSHQKRSWNKLVREKSRDTSSWKMVAAGYGLLCEEVYLFSPWDMWISPKLFLDQLNAWNWSENGLRIGPQTFIQCCQEKIQQSPLQYSVLFALGQSHMDLMMSRTID